MNNIDIIICHSEQDNSSEWVSNFQNFLNLMTNQVIGERLYIVSKSESIQLSDDELKNAKVLVSVLSSSFIESKECLDTLESFVSNIDNDSKVKYYKRAIKVFKTPISYKAQPPKLRDQLGYDFYPIDQEATNHDIEFDYFSTEAKRNYWMEMVDLAYDIHETILNLKGEGDLSETKSIFYRKNIYLAETGHDLIIQKNIIRRELLRHGYNVLPDHTLSSSTEVIEKNAHKELKESSLSIHLIGSSYGHIPENSDRSIVDIQNQIAADISEQSKGTENELSRLIWISPEQSNISEKQRSFIEKIKRDTSSIEGAEILQTSLEDFKNVIRNELLDASLDKKLSNYIDSNDTTEEKIKQIYLVYDQIDDDQINPIKELIEQKGHKVITPSFDADLLELRENHISNLKKLDAALIYKGVVNMQWVRMKVLDIMKAPGFGRQKPILAKAIITAPDQKISKNDLGNNDIELITGQENNINESLSYFLDSLN